MCRPSRETLGKPAAASGRSVYPAGAGASRNATKVAQVAYQSPPQFQGVASRAGSSVGLASEGRTMRRGPPVGAAVLEAEAALRANVDATPSATKTASRREPTRRWYAENGSSRRAAS